jgi:cysteine desulfuration protein SufE
MSGEEEIRSRLERLIKSLCLLPDGEERLRFLMQLGRKYPAMDEALKTEDRLLPGCISRLWIAPEARAGRLYFPMDAEAAISKGIAAAVCGLYEGQEPVDILKVEPDFFEPTGLTALISPNRSNALASLRGFIRRVAEAAG